ncbi:tryptophan synthase alpha chain [Streptococcus rupicaprae]|uniref:Tryptophan synthase alpha chain n=1 Tax=Streptococcus rupicaprae TaxID=759619 RepID=A0ABV2FFD5_9STRE
MRKHLERHLMAIKSEGRGLFIPYIMAGDHEKGLEGLAETLSQLEDLGVSAIELGVPFSDPVADGPVIEAAGQRSLARGVTLSGLIDVLKGYQTDLPLVIMSYLNPIYQYGIERFITALSETPVKGLIILDLPHEHSLMIKSYLTDTDIALVPLVSLTTGLDRQKRLLKDAEGFVYAVAVNGVTGLGKSYKDELDSHLAQLSELADLSVLTGFGVSTKEDIDRFNRVSDGVIVGSKIVDALYRKDDSIKDLIRYAVQASLSDENSLRQEKVVTDVEKFSRRTAMGSKRNLNLLC